MRKTLSRLPIVERIVHYWRIFSRYVGKHLWVFVLISFLGPITDSVGISLFFPLLTGLQGGGQRSNAELRFTHALAALGVPYDVPHLLLTIAVVFTLKATFQFAAGTFQSRISARYFSALTQRAYDAVTAQEYQQFLKENLGVLGNAVVNETYRAMVALMKFAALFPSIITIGIFSILAFRLDPGMTIAAGVFGGALLALTRSVARLARLYSIENTEASGHLNGLVLQSFGSFKYLRATMSLEPLRRQAGRSIEWLSNTYLRSAKTAIFSQSLNEPVVVLFMVGMIWQRTVVGGQPISEVVVLALFFFRLIKEVMNFQNNWHAFSSTMGSVDKVSSIIRDAEAHRERFNGKPYPGLQRAIRAEGVTFAYGERRVLAGINLEIPKNAMVAMVGESGSGKSTFVDLVTGMLRPAEGRLLLDDLPYDELDLATFRRRIGFVSQEPALFNDTVLANITLWDEGNPAEIRGRAEAAARAANCSGFLELQPKGFDTVLGDRGVNLSGGQRQRIAIARELYKQPDLLILDEATSALDSETELEIQRSIEALKGRLTTLVIAHRLSTIRNADLIFVFSNGELVEQGDFAALYSRSGNHFRHICDLQGLK